MEYIKYHKDGSIWAKGQTNNGVMEGYWEWFRKPANSADKIGTIMRSGYFKNGKQVGQWTTYNKHGDIVKVTDFNKKNKK